MGVRVQFDEDEEDEGGEVVYEIKDDQEDAEELGEEAEYDETLKRTDDYDNEVFLKAMHHSSTFRKNLMIRRGSYIREILTHIGFNVRCRNSMIPMLPMKKSKMF